MTRHSVFGCTPDVKYAFAAPLTTALWVQHGYRPLMFRVGKWESHYTVSDEGRAGIAKLALLWDQHVDALNAWMDVFGLTQCEHRRPLTDLSWEVNTYAFNLDDADEPAIFILCGFHDDASGFCVAQAYHAAGVFCTW